MSRCSKGYVSAIRALYGDSEQLVGLKIKKPVNKPNCPYEKEEQFIVSGWLTIRGIKHNHSPNGGTRSDGERAQFGRLGTSSGFPDLEIPYARKGYHGLYIEVKRQFGGTLAENQRTWGNFLISEGYAWYECRGAAECKKVICDYFDLNEKD